MLLRNPLHLRLEKLATWQHMVFMACLCERMLPNFQLFCQITEQPQAAKLYDNILALVWQSQTVKGAKIDFDKQLEKLATIIPSITDYDFYGVHPAVEACEALCEVLNSLLTGESLAYAIKVSQISVNTVAVYALNDSEQELTEAQINQLADVEAEWDSQWQIYRLLKECEERDLALINGLRSELKALAQSNLGVVVANLH